MHQPSCSINRALSPCVGLLVWELRLVVVATAKTAAILQRQEHPQPTLHAPLQAAAHSDMQLWCGLHVDKWPNQHYQPSPTLGLAAMTALDQQCSKGPGWTIKYGHNPV